MPAKTHTKENTFSIAQSLFCILYVEDKEEAEESQRIYIFRKPLKKLLHEWLGKKFFVSC